MTTTHDPLAAMDAADPTARVVAARDARTAAQIAYEQSVRDAVAAGASIASIARALGISDRSRLSAIAGGSHFDEAPKPQLTPVVYLRGAHCGDAIWARVHAAMWARGWATTSDRTDAWHLARGGVPVVLLDFSAQTGTGHVRDEITVARVRAKYGQGEDGGEPGATMELPAIGGTRHLPRPYRLDDDGQRRLDEQAMAVAVGDALSAA